MTNVPASARKPQDHKKAAEPTAAEEVDGAAPREIDFHGKKYRVDLVAVFDDRPVRKALTVMERDADGDDPAAANERVRAFDTVFDALIGDQSDRFDREQKAIHGRVSTELMAEFVEAAFSGNSDGSPT